MIIMKTIELAGIEYSIKDYIAAPDMVGLNIFSLFALTEKMQVVTDEGEILQLIINNMGELTALCERIVISPKIENPKMALILGLFLNQTFMESFTESFSGLSDIMESPEKNE